MFTHACGPFDFKFRPSNMTYLVNGTFADKRVIVYAGFEIATILEVYMQRCAASGYQVSASNDVDALVQEIRETGLYNLILNPVIYTEADVPMAKPEKYKSQVAQVFFETSVDALKIPAKVKASLKKEGLGRLGTLTQSDANELRTINGIGPKTLKAIEDGLSYFGLCLNMPEKIEAEDRLVHKLERFSIASPSGKMVIIEVPDAIWQEKNTPAKRSYGPYPVIYNVLNKVLWTLNQYTDQCVRDVKFKL